MLTRVRVLMSVSQNVALNHIALNSTLFGNALRVPSTYPLTCLDTKCMHRQAGPVGRLFSREKQSCAERRQRSARCGGGQGGFCGVYSQTKIRRTRTRPTLLCDWILAAPEATTTSKQPRRSHMASALKSVTPSTYLMHIAYMAWALLQPPRPSQHPNSLRGKI